MKPSQNSFLPLLLPPLLLLLLLSGGSLAAAPADEVFQHPVAVAELQAILASAGRPAEMPEVLRGEFTQKRYLQELARPLRSSGDFVLAPAFGVAWRTLQPIASEVILTRDGALRLRDAGGAAPERAGLQAVARIFFTVLALEVQELSRDFDLFGRGADGAWTVGLRPRQPAIAAALSWATLEGGVQLRRVEFGDARGDRSVIEFSSLSEQPRALTEQERLRLGI